MWVFDGEEWVEEGKSEQKREDRIQIRIEQFVPEMQVIEVVPLPQKNPFPPFPLP